MPDLTPGVPSALSPLVRRIVAPNPGPFTGPGHQHLSRRHRRGRGDRPRSRRQAPHRRHRRRVDAGAGSVGAAHPHAPRSRSGHDAPREGDGRRGARVRQAARQGRRRGARSRRSARATRSRAPSSASRCSTPPVTRRTTCASCSRRSGCCSPATPCSTGMYSVVSPQPGRRHGGCTSRTLARLEKMRLARLCPGHGDVIEEPRAVVQDYLAHRNDRERQILELAQGRPGSHQGHRRLRSTGTASSIPSWWRPPAGRCTRSC